MVAKKISVLAVGAAALMALTACGSSSSGSSASGGSSPTAAPNSTATAGQVGDTGNSSGGTNGGTNGGSNGGSNGGTGGGIANCTAGDLKADLEHQPEVTGTIFSSWMLMVTNTSSGRCHLYGYPSFGMEDGSGALMADSKTTYTSYPGAAVSIDLAPGGTAFAGVKWSSCQAADLVGGLVMTPPGQYSHTTVNITGPNSVSLWKICAPGITAGTFQPSHEGVVFTS
jgi:Protein of unknown function (DUF4232)